jgi:hypothetical protein
MGSDKLLPHDSSYFVFDLNMMAPKFYTLHFFVMKGALTEPLLWTTHCKQPEPFL